MSALSFDEVLRRTHDDVFWVPRDARVESRAEIAYLACERDVPHLNIVTRTRADEPQLPALVQEVQRAHAGRRSRWTSFRPPTAAALDGALQVAGYSPRSLSQAAVLSTAAADRSPRVGFDVQRVASMQQLRDWVGVVRRAFPFYSPARPLQRPALVPRSGPLMVRRPFPFYLPARPLQRPALVPRSGPLMVRRPFPFYLPARPLRRPALVPRSGPLMVRRPFPFYLPARPLQRPALVPRSGPLMVRRPHTVAEPTQQELDDDLLQCTGPGARIGRWLAYDGEEPISAGALTAYPELNFGLLWGAGTAPEARGRGAYSAIVRVRAEFARARGLEHVGLWANVETSLPIVKRRGFKTHGEMCVWGKDP